MPVYAFLITRFLPPMEVIFDVENIGPCKLERLCQEITPPAKARIVEIEDDRGYCIQVYQCQWTLDQTKNYDSLMDEFDHKVTAIGGRVVRNRVAVPIDWNDTREVTNEEYIEWIVPMRAKTRSEACRGLRRALTENIGGTVEISRDCLETISTVGRFYVTMRFQGMSMQHVIRGIASLHNVLDRWKKSYAHVEINCRGTRIICDTVQSARDERT